MSIETCITRNAISGYKIRQVTKTQILIDDDIPTKGYTSSYTDTAIVCMEIDYTGNNIAETTISETSYLLNVLYDSSVGIITETDKIVDPDGNVREILLVEKYQVGDIKSFTLYIK